MRTVKPIRIKIVDTLGNVKYLSIVKGRVSLVSDKDIPFALSNIADNAAELRFRLQDAVDGSSALKHVRQYVHPTYKIQLF